MALLTCCRAEKFGYYYCYRLFATSSDSTLILSTIVRKSALSSGEKLWAKEFSKTREFILPTTIAKDVSNIVIIDIFLKFIVVVYIFFDFIVFKCNKNFIIIIFLCSLLILNIKINNNSNNLDS